MPSKGMQKLMVCLSSQSNQSNLIKDHLSNYSDIGNHISKLLLFPSNNSVKTDTLSSVYPFLWCSVPL